MSPLNIQIHVSFALSCGLHHDRLLIRVTALQWHYRILQALALDEDLPEKPEDKTLPKYKQIDKVCSTSPTNPPIHHTKPKLIS